jgi:hypothetical protein
MEEEKKAANKITDYIPTQSDSVKKQTDFFQSEFNDKKDPAQNQPGKVMDGTPDGPEPVLRKAKVYEYRPPKYFTDYVVSGFNNTVLTINKFQPYANGQGPVQLSNGNSFNGLIRMGTSDLMEDYKFTGGIRLASNLIDNDVLFNFTNQRKRFDWGITYYRSSNKDFVDPNNTGNFVEGKIYESYYLANIRYPLDRIRSLRATVGPRFDRTVITSVGRTSLETPDKKRTYGQLSLEYVYDNSISPATNIWKGLRYKLFADLFTQLSELGTTEGKFLFNVGFDARHYLPIYRNAIWAVRVGGDFSWGDQKVVYYLGGVDNWFSPKFNNVNTPDPSVGYSYQSLAVNLRGFQQNVSNGNNALVINSEVRLPVFTTLFNKPINNAFLRNFQLVQFFDLGAAWTGDPFNIERPNVIYVDPNDPTNPVSVRIRAGGIGPLAGGYGFGARSTLLGYFLRVDAAWEMNGLFRGKPMWYFAMGFDF